MAWATGTATGYKDLLDKLRLFVTTNAALVSAGQNWAVERWDTSDEYELILKGPGLTAADEIMVGIQSYSSAPDDYYNWRLGGFAGFDTNVAFAEQPGANPMPPHGDVDEQVLLHLWDSSIPYWFVANGRRIVVVAKVSTVYQSMYLGFYLPYASPGQSPYPLVVGGSGCKGADRWSATGDWSRCFCDPDRYVGSFSNPIGSPLRVRQLDGSYIAFGRGSDARVSPRADSDAVNVSMANELITCPDGTYPALQHVLATAVPANNVLGEFDGVLFVPGYSLAAEDVIDVGGVDHLAVQSTFRTTNSDYFLLRLE